MTGIIQGAFWDDYWKVVTKSGNWYYLANNPSPDDPLLRGVVESYRKVAGNALKVKVCSPKILSYYEIL